jgi:hypothetical protein
MEHSHWTLAAINNNSVAIFNIAPAMPQATTATATLKIVSRWGFSMISQPAHSHSGVTIIAGYML